MLLQGGEAEAAQGRVELQLGVSRTISQFGQCQCLTNYASKWGSWNTDAEKGTPEYYSKQLYTKGARCWNGPERTVSVSDVTLVAIALRRAWVSRACAT